MEAERGKFAMIGEIYIHLTEENKENLFKTAENLLEVQKEDAEILSHLKSEESKNGLA